MRSLMLNVPILAEFIFKGFEKLWKSLTEEKTHSSNLAFSCAE